MSEVSIIGLDIAKHVFQAHGADASGRAVLRKKLSRSKVLPFFASQPRCRVVLEACGGAHHWARDLARRDRKNQGFPPCFISTLG